MILTTTVAPAPDRNTIIDCFKSDIENGAKAFMVLQDNKLLKTSSIARYKNYNSEVKVIGSDDYERTNYRDTHIKQLSKSCF